MFWWKTSETSRGSRMSSSGLISRRPVSETSVFRSLRCRCLSPRGSRAAGFFALRYHGDRGIADILADFFSVVHSFDREKLLCVDVFKDGLWPYRRRHSVSWLSDWKKNHKRIPMPRMSVTACLKDADFSQMGRFIEQEQDGVFLRWFSLCDGRRMTPIHSRMTGASVSSLSWGRHR